MNKYVRLGAAAAIAFIAVVRVFWWIWAYIDWADGDVIEVCPEQMLLLLTGGFILYVVAYIALTVFIYMLIEFAYTLIIFIRHGCKPLPLGLLASIGVMFIALGLGLTRQAPFLPLTSSPVMTLISVGSVVAVVMSVCTVIAYRRDRKARQVISDWLDNRGLSKDSVRTILNMSLIEPCLKRKEQEGLQRIYIKGHQPKTDYDKLLVIANKSRAATLCDELVAHEEVFRNGAPINIKVGHVGSCEHKGTDECCGHQLWGERQEDWCNGDNQIVQLTTEVESVERGSDDNV